MAAPRTKYCWLMKHTRDRARVFLGNTYSRACFISLSLLTLQGIIKVLSSLTAGRTAGSNNRCSDGDTTNGIDANAVYRLQEKCCILATGTKY